MAYSNRDTVLLTYDKILQFVVDLDLRFTDEEMYDDLRDRIATSGFSQSLSDKIIDVVDYIETNGGVDD